jgi:hypothetical protein
MVGAINAWSLVDVLKVRPLLDQAFMFSFRNFPPIIAKHHLPFQHMTPIQEMVIALFASDTLEKVRGQFKSGKEIVSAEKFDLPLRLLKVDAKTINLEMLVQRAYGPPRREAVGMVRSGSTYFKPIGVYSLEKGVFASKIDITILQEFADDYNALQKRGIIRYADGVKNFSLIENTAIAAFSMDAVIEARDNKDKALIINGLSVEIIMASAGYPQLFLDDYYRVKGPIAAYFSQGPNSLNPTIAYKAVFDDLSARKLLSAYKAV